MTEDDGKAVGEFRKAVNTTAKKLEKWLETEESKKVGDKNDGTGESVGHGFGKKIVKILNEDQFDYTADDLKYIHKIVGYVHRHSVQRPDGDITKTNWRYSLMNWGQAPAE